MKNVLSDKMEAGRIKLGRYGTDKSYGPVGCFEVFHGATAGLLVIMASDGIGDAVAQGWEHVSVSLTHRTPNWAEMCWVKSEFWNEDEQVMEFHPAKDQYVNHHANCLHLWRHPRQMIIYPPKLLVGPG
jgi:hypothetical protein